MNLVQNQNAYCVKLCYPIHRQMNSDTQNVVCVLTCQNCPDYIGETSKPTRIRMNNHRFDVNHGRRTDHFQHMPLAIRNTLENV